AWARARTRTTACSHRRRRRCSRCAPRSPHRCGEDPQSLIKSLLGGPLRRGITGVWRGLVARAVRDGKVAGSNPVTPTTEKGRGIEHRSPAPRSSPTLPPPPAHPGALRRTHLSPARHSALPFPRTAEEGRRGHRIADISDKTHISDLRPHAATPPWKVADRDCCSHEQQRCNYHDVS